MGSEYNPNFVIQMIENQDFDIIIDMMRFRDRRAEQLPDQLTAEPAPAAVQELEVFSDLAAQLPDPRQPFTIIFSSESTQKSGLMNRTFVCKYPQAGVPHFYKSESSKVITGYRCQCPQAGNPHFYFPVLSRSSEYPTSGVNALRRAILISTESSCRGGLGARSCVNALRRAILISTISF